MTGASLAKAQAEFTSNVLSNEGVRNTAASAAPQGARSTFASGLLDQIKVRRLDVFFELEEKIMSGTTLDKSIMEVLNDPENGTADDKMRLFLIYFLCGPALTDAELDQYSGALQAAGCDLSPLTYMKRWKTYGAAIWPR